MRISDWSSDVCSSDLRAMAMSDPLGDLLTRIRNGQRSGKSKVRAPASKLRANVLDVLKREGYIRDYRTEEVGRGLAEVEFELKYNEGAPVIQEIERVSRPGRRVYSKIKVLPRFYTIRRASCWERVCPSV